jgi:hypothetical protein
VTQFAALTGAPPERCESRRWAFLFRRRAAAFDNQTRRNPAAASRRAADRSGHRDDVCARNASQLWYREWYRRYMAMNLRLTDEDTEALRTYATVHSTSMQQAAIDGIRQMLHGERRARLIRHILDEDRELLHRLAQ